MLKMHFAGIAYRNSIKVIEIIDNIVGILSEKLESLSHMDKQAFIIRFERFYNALYD